MNRSITTFSDSKSHYQILDGLRGVAAILVVLFHILEIFSGYDHKKQIINHGYLAVDFFFLLSGFVIGYAYDDRWSKMSIKEFFKRRLIRLHPMIILGMIIGAILFYFSASPTSFPHVAEYPIWKLMLVMLVGFTLLPIPAHLDIRGWGQMHPLNGPAWSLLFEYIANILYALFIRKFSKTVLAILVCLAGCLLIHLAVTYGDVVGGWSLRPKQIRIGLTRLIYPFFAGLLISRVHKPGHFKNAFLWCSLLLVSILSFPRLGGGERLWLNGLYDSFSIIILFPIIVYLGANGKVTGDRGIKICKFLGDISYPLYITHYPLIYIYIGWVTDHKLSILRALPVGLIVFIASLALAYGSLKVYDMPVRNWLIKKLYTQKEKHE